MGKPSQMKDPETQFLRTGENRGYFLHRCKRGKQKCVYFQKMVLRERRQRVFFAFALHRTPSEQQNHTANNCLSKAITAPRKKQIQALKKAPAKKPNGQQANVHSAS